VQVYDLCGKTVDGKAMGRLLFVMFIDLEKGYNSVPRSALWTVLLKCGMPPTMLNIIQSFHDGM